PRRTLAALRAAPPPLRWDPALRGPDRLRAIVAVFTRMRTCTAHGTLDMEFAGPPERVPLGRKPRFDWPRRYGNATVVCGHWARLGLKIAPHVMTLDTGCVWGNSLSAVRLEDGRVFQEPADRRRG